MIVFGVLGFVIDVNMYDVIKIKWTTRKDIGLSGIDYVATPFILSDVRSVLFMNIPVYV